MNDAQIGEKARELASIVCKNHLSIRMERDAGGGCYSCSKHAEAIASALRSAYKEGVEDAAKRVTTLEMELREFYWQNHGHGFADLYGDDGEMQCQTCVRNGHKHWDYLRAPFDEIRAQYIQVSFEETAKAQLRERKQA